MILPGMHSVNQPDGLRLLRKQRYRVGWLQVGQTRAERADGTQGLVKAHWMGSKEGWTAQPAVM
jgi:hypothetical protein